jgi:hypothetical protein
VDPGARELLVKSATLAVLHFRTSLDTDFELRELMDTISDRSFDAPRISVRVVVRHPTQGTRPDT